MYKKETIAKLAELAGVSSEDFIKNFKAEEEHEIEGLNDARVFTAEKFNTFKANLVADSRKGIIEVAVKNFKKDKNLDFEGKTIEALSSFITQKASEEAGAEPEAKYKSLETKYKNFKKESDAYKQDAETKFKSLASKLFTTEVKSKALSNLKTDTVIKKDDIYLIFTNSIIPKEVEGKIVAANKNTGEILKDENLEPISFIDKFKTFVDSDYIKSSEPDGGRKPKGGVKNNDGVLIFANMSDWSAHYSEDTGTEEAINSLAASQSKEGFKVDVD